MNVVSRMIRAHLLYFHTTETAKVKQYAKPNMLGINKTVKNHVDKDIQHKQNTKRNQEVELRNTDQNHWNLVFLCITHGQTPINVINSAESVNSNKSDVQ